MRYGVTIFPTTEVGTPAELAQAAEAAGFALILFPEHTHIPVSRRSPWPGGPDLPDYYWKTHDPFVACTQAAAATTSIRVGPGICLIAQRDVFSSAKSAASVDVLSSGRFVFGVGYGWNREEAEDHGVVWARRRAGVAEKVAAMRELWTADEPAFDGEHISFEPCRAWPKPVQKPGPPVWLGASPGPKTFEAVADWADAWMPIAGRGGAFGTAVVELRKTCERMGRDPSTVEVNMFYAPPKPEVLDEFEQLGVSDAIFGLPQSSRDDALAAIDKLGGLIAGR